MMQQLQEEYTFHPSCKDCCAKGLCHWCLNTAFDKEKNAVITVDVEQPVAGESGKYSYRACLAHFKMFERAATFENVTSAANGNFTNKNTFDGSIKVGNFEITNNPTLLIGSRKNG